MRFHPQIIAAGLAVLGLGAGCGSDRGSQPAERARIATSSALDQSSADATDAALALLAPASAIPAGQSVLQVINATLDAEQNQEQVIVMRARNQPAAPLFVGVVDYDTTAGAYIVSWTHPTLATNPRTFSVTTEDLLGDHSFEIVCAGTDESGAQTLDVFHSAPAPAGTVLSFSPIFSDAVKGTINIERSERSEAYKLSQDTGDSFPIDVSTQDPQSNHLGDLITTTYTWSPTSGSYVQSSEQHIPGQQIEDQQLAALYAAGSDAFESFLAGPWYKTNRSPEDTSSADAQPAEDGSGDLTTATIVSFDLPNREVTFYAGDVMEIYVWESSYRTLYNSLAISAYNELVQYIKAQVSVAVLSTDSIAIGYPDAWAGTYFRLTKAMQASLIHPSPEKTEWPDLAGEYLGESGDHLNFAGHNFSESGRGPSRSGGVSLFMFGQPVMVLHYMKSDGIVTDTKTFRFAYQEESSPSRTVRTIRLTPGRLGMSGFSPTGDPTVRYVQIQEINHSP